MKILVLLLLFFTACDSPRPTTGPEFWNSDEGRITALVKSQTFMKRRLKAPADADFPYITSSGVKVLHRGGGVFSVDSYVDAPNSFGVKLRTRYVCELKQSGDQWELTALTEKP